MRPGPRVLARQYPCGQPAAGLTDRDRAILEFEQGWWRWPGRGKALAITAQLGLSPARYYELLNAPRRPC